MREDGDLIPRPRSLAAIKADPTLAGDLSGALIRRVRRAPSWRTRAFHNRAQPIRCGVRETVLPALRIAGGGSGGASRRDAAADDLPAWTSRDPFPRNRLISAPGQQASDRYSSSRSSQCRPSPDPLIPTFVLCWAEAFSRRGNHASGTPIVRPSDRSTRSVSASKRTALSRSGHAMPLVQEFAVL